MTDFRALCAELVEQWDNAGDLGDVGNMIERARAALAQPEPQDEEILELMPQQLREDLATVSRLAAYGAGPDVGPGLYRVTLNTGIAAHCRAVLQRWGRPAIEPETEHD